MFEAFFLIPAEFTVVHKLQLVAKFIQRNGILC